MTPPRPVVAAAATVLLVVCAAGVGVVPMDAERPNFATTVTVATLAVDAAPAALPAIGQPAVATAPATRVDLTAVTITAAPTTTWELPEVVNVGLWGLPYAPDGLDACAEFDWYRRQWGLPAQFDRLAYRESRCVQDDGPNGRTSCCVGYLQLFVSLHLRDPIVGLRYQACGIDSEYDLDSGTPIEKQRQLCAARALYDVVGMSPWRQG